MTSSSERASKVVTFLFTDIVGSTRLWDREPEQMRSALARHDALGRAAIERNHGSIVKLTGDGFHAAFDDPLDALTAALDFQRSLPSTSTADAIAIQIRCGMHAGTVEARDDDYFGTVVNHAHRIMDAAHGGQILVSQVVATLIDERLPHGVSLRDLGAVRLRDLTGAKRVFQVVHPQLRQDFPALRSLEATPNNLPQQVTSFIGRQRELAEISERLPKARLLTLVGTGGIGKTRLLLQLAANLLDSYPDGVWYVDLDPVDDPELVVNALARVLGLTEVPGAPLIETIGLHMKSHRTLVLLDGCEHVLSAAARLAGALLRAGPDIHVLVTSREPLRIAGEQTALLSPLALPDEAADLAFLLRADAVRLFVERVRSRQPKFAVTEENAPAVAKICTRLDGVPLALELAAARVGALSLEKIAARLDDRFGLLKSGDRTALPRQQTLKALIDWSYDLLDAREKRLLARLSVFAAGWTLDGAEAVCADEALAKADILDVLDQLVQKSLAIRHEHQDRYGFLETIHDYALSRLRDSGELEALRDRHRRYFLALAEDAEPAFRKRTGELPWLQRLEAEHANLKAALEWSLEQRDGGVDALRMCGVLGRFWKIRGHWREGRDWCWSALQKAAEAAPKDVRGKALITAGSMNFWLGETVAAEALVETALELAREAGNRGLEASALNNLSNLVSDHGNFARAHSLLHQSVAINRELGNREGECINLNNIGVHFLDERDAAAAEAPLERALALSRDVRSNSLEAISLGNVARLAERRGDYERARRLAADSLAIFRGLASLAEEVEQTLTLARIGVACGEPGPAARHLIWALGTSRKLGHRSIVQCLDVMVGLAATVGACEKAAAFQGACQNLRELTAVLATPAEAEQSRQACSACQAVLGEAAFASAEAAGRASSTESTIATGLEWLAAIARERGSQSVDAGARPDVEPSSRGLAA